MTEVSTWDRALPWQLELKVSKSFHCFGVKACPNIKTRTMKIIFIAAVWEKCVYEKKTKEKLSAKFNTAICVICLPVWKYIENKTAKEGFFSSSRQFEKMFGAWINHCNL